MAHQLAKPKNSWVYICQPTGTGKTTEMLEVGYLAALDLLSKKGSSKVTLRLVVMTEGLAVYYKNLFADKQAAADPRVEIIWQDLKSFKETWNRR